MLVPSIIVNAFNSLGSHFLCLIELCFECLFLIFNLDCVCERRFETMDHGLGVYIFVYATLVDGQVTTLDFLMISFY
jgi:hypothetical protein